MKHWLLLLCISFCSLSSYAAIKDVHHTTTGYGPSYAEALAQALLEAVSQVRGASVSTQKQLKVDFQQMLQPNAMVVQHNSRVEQNVWVQSKGFVKSYQVLETAAPSANNQHWRVKIRAIVPTYEIKAVDQRKRLAIMPMYNDQGTFLDANGRQLSKAWVAERLTDSLVAHFTQSNRFSVLDYQHTVDLALEYQLLKSRQIAPQDSARIGQLLGANYILVTELDGVKHNANTQQFYGMEKHNNAVGLSVTYRLIDVETQNIVWANSMARVIAVDEVDFSQSSQTQIAKGTWFDIFDQMVNPIVTDVMEVSYPIRILDVISDQAIYINQGALRMQAGDSYSVYNQGFKVIDMDTKLPIDIDGSEVATIQITHVLPKYSVAKLVKGQISDMKNGDILRVSHHDTANTQGHPETAGSSEAPLQW